MADKKAANRQTREAKPVAAAEPAEVKPTAEQKAAKAEADKAAQRKADAVEYGTIPPPYTGKDVARLIKKLSRRWWDSKGFYNRERELAKLTGGSE